MIRQLKTNEIDKVMEIWLESTIKAHSFIDRTYWEESYKLVEEVYIPHAETFVYEEDNEIKGFISVIEGKFIGALFVKIQEQGKGIGTQLLDHIVKSYKEIELAVYKENSGAVEFYKAKGFEVVREQANEDTAVREYIMKYGSK